MKYRMPERWRNSKGTPVCTRYDEAMAERLRLNAHVGHTNLAYLLGITTRTLDKWARRANVELDRVKCGPAKGTKMEHYERKPVVRVDLRVERMMDLSRRAT